MAEIAFAAGFAQRPAVQRHGREPCTRWRPSTLRAEAGPAQAARRRPGTLVAAPAVPTAARRRGPAAASSPLRAVAGVEAVGDGDVPRARCGCRTAAATVALHCPTRRVRRARRRHAAAGRPARPGARGGPAAGACSTSTPTRWPSTTLLGADPALAPAVEEVPGIRLPGSVDGSETAVRAVLGQQVSVAAARTACRAGWPKRWASGCRPRSTSPGAELLFPTPAAIAEHGAEVLTGAWPGGSASVCAVAAALADGTLALDPGRDPADRAGRAGRAARRRAVDRRLPRDARARRPRRAAGRPTSACGAAPPPSACRPTPPA